MPSLLEKVKHIQVQSTALKAIERSKFEMQLSQTESKVDMDLGNFKVVSVSKNLWTLSAESKTFALIEMRANAYESKSIKTHQGLEYSIVGDLIVVDTTGRKVPVTEAYSDAWVMKRIGMFLSSLTKKESYNA